MNFTEDSIAGAAGVGLRTLKKAYRALRAATAPAPTDLAEPDTCADRSGARRRHEYGRGRWPCCYEFAGKRAAVRARGAGETLYEFATRDAARHRAQRLVARRAGAALAPATSSSASSRVARGRRDAAVDGATPRTAIARVIEMRARRARAKDWAASDRLRDALQHCGIEFKDSKEGTTWSVASAG